MKEQVFTTLKDVQRQRTQLIHLHAAVVEIYVEEGARCVIQRFKTGQIISINLVTKRAM